MPTQIRRPSAQALAPTAADVNSDSLTPLTIIAILVFVLHLAGTPTLGRSQADSTIGRAGSGADGAARCAAEAKPAERPLPFD
jgi:hypothetical protein